jgi:hypothetical protein
VTHHTRTEYTRLLQGRYTNAASKGERSRLLDEYCRMTGLHRKAAIRRLRGRRRRSGGRRGRPRRYGPDLAPVVARLWEIADRPCGMLLAAVLPTLLPALEQHGALRLRAAQRAAVLTMSPATLDRVLRPVRAQRAAARPGRRAPTVLATQVPIRTWGDWKGVRPGAVQADLVLHCGTSTAGFYLSTLVAVDVATGWVELEPVWGLTQEHVRAAVARLLRRTPHRVHHWHTDNDVAFLNGPLLDYCRRHDITVSRGRGYRKNDQAYVEQRNWFAVRRLVGRDRYASRAAFHLLRRLYPLLRVQLNFLRPLRKLAARRRVGARTRKRYDPAATPYQRLLAARVLPPAQRDALADQFRAVNPATLAAQIQTCLDTLWRLAERPRATTALG